MPSDTLLQQKGIQRRMQCTANVASNIESAFVTVEQLVDAVESDTPLTEIDGVGPKTAETIQEWWAERFERERRMDGATMERTSTRSAMIHLHKSWADALGMEVDDAE